MGTLVGIRRFACLLVPRSLALSQDQDLKPVIGWGSLLLLLQAPKSSLLVGVLGRGGKEDRMIWRGGRFTGHCRQAQGCPNAKDFPRARPTDVVLGRRTLVLLMEDI